MKLVEKCHKNLKAIVCLLLIVSTVFSNSITAFASPTGLTFTMTNGGTWDYLKMDTSTTRNWSQTDYRSFVLVQKVTFITPDQVKNQLFSLTKSVGVDLSKSAVKYAVETAASSGIEIAKKKLIAKFGSSVAGKVIPYVSIFSWAYTAYDILSSVATGQQLTLLSNAVSKGTGLIYVKQRNTGDASRYYYWDGSSQYGKYPSAILNPNKYEYGKITKY